MQKQNKKVCLLLDNCSAHKIEADRLEQRSSRPPVVRENIQLGRKKKWVIIYVS